MFPFSSDLIKPHLSVSTNKLFNHGTSHEGETKLKLWLQTRERNNPKHGRVVEIHASVHCQPVGMLSDDAPDPSSSSSSSSSTTTTTTNTVTFRIQHPTDPTHPLLRTWGGGGGGGETRKHSQIIHRAPLLNMWLTHWESLWEIRLKNELFIRTWNTGPIGQRDWRNTPTICPKQHYKFDHDTSHCSYSFL